MKRGRLFIVAGLVLGLSAVASAKAISVANSTYGPFGNVVNMVNGDLNEQYYYDSDGVDAVFVYQINTDTNNFTLDISAPGGATFIADDTSTPPNFLGFGAFVGSGCPAFSTSMTTVLCGPDSSMAPYNATSTPSGSDGTENSVSISGNGDGKGLVFFVVLPDSAVFSTTCSSPPCEPAAPVAFAMPTATLTSGTPEPRLWPVFGLAIAGFLLFRRRSVKSA